MEDVKTGVKGDSPTPSSGVSGSSPAPSKDKTSISVSPQGKIDYGMGPQSQTKSWENIQWNEIPDEVFWEKNGERIYKHDRFKELNGYKEKYQEFEPIKQFVDTAGGMQRLQALETYLGPVWSHLSTLNEQDANKVWTKLYPYLQAVLSGGDLPDYATGSSAVSEPQEEDEFTTKLKPLQEEVGSLKQTIEEQREAERIRKIEERRSSQLSNLEKYKTLLGTKLKEIDPTNNLSLEDVEDWVMNNLWKYMPKTPDGKLHVNPLDVYTEKAMTDVFDNVILPRLRKFEGYTINKNKKSIEDGGPTIPDTSNGQTPGNQQMTTLAQRQAMMAQRIRAMSH